MTREGEEANAEVCLFARHVIRIRFDLLKKNTFILKFCKLSRIVMIEAVFAMHFRERKIPHSESDLRRNLIPILCGNSHDSQKRSPFVAG